MDNVRQPGASDPDEMLRAKYHDFCSARVVELLLELSPDEMYVLAEAAAGGPGERGSLSYNRIVQLATARITQDADLPTFAEWAEAYRAAPEKFDDLIMGLWEDPAGRPT